MNTPIQLTRTYAGPYEISSRRAKGTILDRLTEETGWTRDYARHQLRSQIRQIQAGVSLTTETDRRHLKPKKFSPQARQVLEFVWRCTGRPCGKYLEAAMADCIDSLQRHGHLREAFPAFTSAVQAELLDISAATIDRYLRTAKRELEEDSWLTGTGAGMRGSLPRQHITALLEPEPGYFIVDMQTIAAGGGGEYRTMTFTDVRIGWVRTMTFAPGTPLTDMLADLVQAIPFVVTGIIVAGSMPVDEVTDWAEDHLIECHSMSSLRQSSHAPDWTFRNQPEHPAVHGIEDPVGAVNELWSALGDRLNFFMPVKNPVGWHTTPSGRRRRTYDGPTTPAARLSTSGILSAEQTRELREKFLCLDIASLTRRIDELKTLLC